jgi:hypothetical protein
MKLKSHSLKILTVIIALTAYLCSFPALGDAAIVCFGDDGHVSIESTTNASLPVQNTKITDHSIETEEDDHCEDQCSSCIDFPLSFSVTKQNITENKYKFKLERNPLFLIDTKILSVAAATIAYRSPPENPQVIDNTITSLRTIVLLI